MSGALYDKGIPARMLYFFLSFSLTFSKVVFPVDCAEEIGVCIHSFILQNKRMSAWIGKISLLLLLVVDASFDKSLTVGVGKDEIFCLNEGTIKDGKLSCNDNKFVLVHTTYEVRAIPDVDTLEALVRQKVNTRN